MRWPISTHIHGVKNFSNHGEHFIWSLFICFLWSHCGENQSPQPFLFLLLGRMRSFFIFLLIHVKLILNVFLRNIIKAHFCYFFCSLPRFEFFLLRKRSKNKLFFFFLQFTSMVKNKRIKRMIILLKKRKENDNTLSLPY